jgi:hypothetical protein
MSASHHAYAPLVSSRHQPIRCQASLTYGTSGVEIPRAGILRWLYWLVQVHVIVSTRISMLCLHLPVLARGESSIPRVYSKRKTKAKGSYCLIQVMFTQGHNSRNTQHTPLSSLAKHPTPLQATYDTFFHTLLYRRSSSPDID